MEENNCLENIFVDFYIREGIFRGATIEFVLKMDTLAYPSVPPEIICLTKIYHPDIKFSDNYEDDDGSVYLSLVNNHWNFDCTLKDIVRALLDLIKNPDLDVGCFKPSSSFLHKYGGVRGECATQPERGEC